MTGNEDFPDGESLFGETDPKSDTASTHRELPWKDFGDFMGPTAPEEVSDCIVDPGQLSDLSLKLAATMTQFTTAWASEKLCLPSHLVDEMYWQLKNDHEVEILGQAGPLNYRYSVTERGRERADRLRMVCGYIGPAPVDLTTYIEYLHWQRSRRNPVTLEAVRSALQDVLLEEDSMEIAALAVASRRSLFMFGPSGNGKTTIGRLLHSVYDDTQWIPHAIQIDSHVIRVFDQQIHQCVPVREHNQELDHRWVHIQRPFIVAGGEMTLEELDLAWNDSLHFYEAPPHFKANGGTFMIDDFGRQRISPADLLNRWIIPLEQGVDYLTLHTGQKIQVPFEVMLTVATNLSVDDVADPAFLRRMGYRLHIHGPSPDQYRVVFCRSAEKAGITGGPEVIGGVLEMYADQQRELRFSEAGDLVQRCLDICQLRRLPMEMTPAIMDAAWRGYFGN